MPYDPPKHRRRSLRLPDYDYSQAGAYFLTIRVHGGHCLLGQVVNGEMVANELGDLVRQEWERSADLRDELRLDEYVVMPNHLHGIVFLEPGEGDPRASGRSPLQIARGVGLSPHSLASFIAGFKSATTKRINERRCTPGVPLWQRNYYEHVIRSDESLVKTREYVANNPLKWELDELHPARSHC
ncbi:MAG: transposase [Chloroflexota bacterium]